jgi:hypothetical protein
MYESCKYQPAQAVWIFYRVVTSLVLKTVNVMRRVSRAFEAFDDLNRDLAQFIELRIFPKCDQLLVPWSRGIEPCSPDQAFEDLDPPELQGYRVPPDTRVSLISS